MDKLTHDLAEALQDSTQWLSAMFYGQGITDQAKGFDRWAKYTKALAAYKAQLEREQMDKQ